MKRSPETSGIQTALQQRWSLCARAGLAVLMISTLNSPGQGDLQNQDYNVIQMPTQTLAYSAAVEGTKQTSVKPSQIPAIINKTLIAWIFLDSASQQGGSALTLIDPAKRMDMTRFVGGGGSDLKSINPEEKFDAIEFSELAPGGWITGSELSRPTLSSKVVRSEESVDTNTLLQIAIVYKGKKVYVYRNGKLCSTDKVFQPHTFNKDMMVLIGLRYNGKAGKQGFLSGAVEEARIYNVALDKSTISSLKPGILTGPKPYAQWTFEDGSTADAMGTFPPGKLCGNARIADGKLYLDGKTGFMITPALELMPIDTTPQGMFYKPTSPETGSMWDSWVFFHKGTYYLFTTCNAGGNLLDNVSMASSRDGVHWTEIGRILSRHPDSDWLGTGSTWKSCNYDKDGKFYMDFCERREKGQREQEIYFAESTDLIHWKRLDDKYVFKADQRWYKPGCWTTIWTVPRPGGGLYGYWTCVPKPETGASFGFGETSDGLTWTVLPPPKVQGIGYCELGAVEKIGSRYYAMVGVEGLMMTVVADRPEGPFYLARNNPHLLGVKKSESHRYLQEFVYFTRFCRTPEGLLVNHHTIARGVQGGSLQAQVYFGLLKSAIVDSEGTLRLGWWNGNEKLKNGTPVLTLSGLIEKEDSSINMIDAKFDSEGGIIIEGLLTMPESKNSNPVGIFISCGEDSGSSVRVYAGGRCEFGEMNADFSGWDAVISVDREMDFGLQSRFRLLLKGSLMEFYMNDILIECYSLPAKATGRIGFMGNISEVKIWNCK